MHRTQGIGIQHFFQLSEDPFAGDHMIDNHARAGCQDVQRPVAQVACNRPDVVLVHGFHRIRFHEIVNGNHLVVFGFPGFDQRLQFPGQGGFPAAGRAVQQDHLPAGGNAAAELAQGRVFPQVHAAPHLIGVRIGGMG